MMSFEDLVAIAPDQVCIPITSEDHKTVTADIQRTPYSNDAARQQAYYNLLSLRLLRTWLADTLEIEPPSPWVAEDTLPSVWDVVNGTAIQVGGDRLVVIPNGDRPLDELSVSQEWVDHPDWCGDYYLAVDINTDQQWLRIVGYTTHTLLKQGMFDDIDRTYCIPVDSLIKDLNVLWVAQDLMPPSKPRVVDLPPLGSETAQRVIRQLGAVKAYSPRLDVPFSQWVALVTHPDYRQALYVERTASAVVNIAQWLQGQFQQGWTAVHAIEPISSKLAIARGTSSSSQGERLVIDGKVSLMVQIEPLNHATKDTTSSEYRVSIRACLSQPLETAQYLSLSCSGGDEDDCQASSPDDSNLELLPLIGEAGEAFEVTLVLGDQQETVQFML
ncbi:MAG: DUF1822 family protein [Leptolyngbya sp. DLM2.Bin15]|nr:MAG: DUF1822 family protein [Leptolyngbya sp. DLM2.Bin15]